MGRSRGDEKDERGGCQSNEADLRDRQQRPTPMRPVYATDGAAAAGSEGPRPGVSTVEVFGFVGWITSSVAYVLFMLWAYTPPSVLEAHGIAYYPSHYWAVALPAWVCVTVVFAYWLYEGLCMMAAAPPGDAACLFDAASRSKEDAGMTSYFSCTDRAIPPLADIPPDIVSMVLYGGLTPQEAEERYDTACLRRGGGSRPRANEGL